LIQVSAAPALGEVQGQELAGDHAHYPGITLTMVAAGVGLFPISDDPDLLARAASSHSLSLAAVLAGVPARPADRPDYGLLARAGWVQPGHRLSKLDVDRAQMVVDTVNSIGPSLLQTCRVERDVSHLIKHS
jgi:hypothetical protein